MFLLCSACVSVAPGDEEQNEDYEKVDEKEEGGRVEMKEDDDHVYEDMNQKTGAGDGGR